MKKPKTVNINIDKLIDNLQITVCSKDDISDGIDASKIDDKMIQAVKNAFIEAEKSSQIVK